MSIDSPKQADRNHTYRFNIAEIPVILKQLQEPHIPISQTLSAFRTHLPKISGKTVSIEFIPDPPNLKIYKQKSLHLVNQPSMTMIDDRVLFTFSTGQFLANRDFTHVKLWAPFEKTIDNTMDGYPWLQLILWGHLSLAGGIYLHGALVVIDGHYVLLLGDSGVGKSTLSNLAVDTGFTRLTEENPFLTWKNDHPWSHALPWPGMAGVPKHPSGPLHAILFLHHSPANELTRLAPADAGRRLLHNSRMFNWLPETIPASVKILNDTLKKTPVFSFGFTPQPPAIDAIRGEL